jgi:hypothetical protein
MTLQCKDIGKYIVRNNGTVYSKHFKRELRQIVPGSHGYLSFRFGKNGRNTLLHRIIAECFIPNPHNYKCINHKDGNKLNNNVNNLEWCSYSQNTLHAFKIGLRNNSYPHPNQRKRVEATKNNNRFVFCSIIEAERKLNILHSSIANSLHGRSKTAGGYQWRYL